MGIRTFEKLPRESIRYLLLCASGLLAFILVAVYPNQKSIAELDLKMQRLQTEIRRQEIFSPVYKGLITKLEIEEKGTLPLPDKKRIGRDKASRISSIFDEAVEESGLDLIMAVPEVKSLGQAPSLLSVQLTLEGSFFDFREFLIHLGEIPFLEHIEEITIESKDKIRRFTVKVWLALKEKEGDKSSSG